ncbi:MAG: hypothetical protein JJU20_00680 [Opitutales bacterium]|nr:hypothetical protein [Opitutales bacterium]
MSKSLSEHSSLSISDLVCDIDVAATLRWIRSRKQITIDGDPQDSLLQIDMGSAEIDGRGPRIEAGYLTLLEAEENGLEVLPALITGEENQARSLGILIEVAVA